MTVSSLNSVWACLAVDCLTAAGLSGKDRSGSRESWLREGRKPRRVLGVLALLFSLGYADLAELPSS
jgi:hypothetical protein